MNLIKCNEYESCCRMILDLITFLQCCCVVTSIDSTKLLLSFFNFNLTTFLQSRQEHIQIIKNVISLDFNEQRSLYCVSILIFHHYRYYNYLEFKKLFSHNTKLSEKNVSVKTAWKWILGFHGKGQLECIKTFFCLKSMLTEQDNLPQTCGKLLQQFYCILSPPLVIFGRKD